MGQCMDRDFITLIFLLHSPFHPTQRGHRWFYYSYVVDMRASNTRLMCMQYQSLGMLSCCTVYLLAKVVILGQSCIYFMIKHFIVHLLVTTDGFNSFQKAT